DLRTDLHTVDGAGPVHLVLRAVQDVAHALRRDLLQDREHDAVELAGYLAHLMTAVRRHTLTARLEEGADLSLEQRVPLLVRDEIDQGLLDLVADLVDVIQGLEF